MSAPTKVIQKCKGCSGDLIFDPSKDGLVCKRCGNFVSVNGAITTEKSFQELLSKAPTWQKGTTIMQCEHCGAKSVVSKFDLAAKCDYCGTANMVKIPEMPGLRPDTVVLFEINRSDAQKQVSNWLAKRFFVPSQFKSQLKDRQLTGVYYPAFTFDTNVTARFTGTLVQTNTTTVVVDGQETTHSQTTRRSISDLETQTYDEIVILATDEISFQTISNLGTFESNCGKVFQQSYLAGFTVCQASKDPEECWAEAKKVAETKIRRKIIARYSADNVMLENLHLDLDFTNITYKYALLPIYVAQVNYKGKKYPLYLNGRTGKIYCKTPRSWWKICLTFAAMGLAAFGMGIFLAFLV